MAEQGKASDHSGHGPDPTQDNGLRLIRSLGRNVALAEGMDGDDGEPARLRATDQAIERRLVAKAWIHARRQRNRAFPASMFADPAWDILLDLYLAHCDGCLVPVSSVCVAANVPTTTALRWIGHLEATGFIARRHDIDDRRRKLLGLTEEAIARLEAALDGATSSDRKLGLGRLQVIDC